MALTASPYLALLDEEDPSLKVYALKSLDNVVDELWSEIANNLADIEELYEDTSFEGRDLAALIASKVYYNLGDYESSVRFSLASGDQFKIDESSEFVETIVSKCIEKYIELSREAYKTGDKSKLEPKLVNIFEKMLMKCIEQSNFSLAIGVALESYRLDIFESIINQQISVKEETSLQLINYALSCLSTINYSTQFKNSASHKLVELILKLKNPDFFMITKLIVQLNDSNLSIKLFKSLADGDDEKNIPIAYQVAFDLVQAASQELLNKTIASLKSSGSDKYAKLIKILSGIPSCDYDITFLHNNNNTDAKILNSSKTSLDGRSSMFHNAISFMNAFLHAGTTDDSFLRKNLEWLGKSSNWSKFTATAALGVIHKGNLSQGKTILEPYLPERTGSHYSQGGSLFALGLIFAGHGNEIIDYMRGHIVEKGSSAGNEEMDVILHGGCLGIGVAAMGTSDESIYEELKTILYSDSAVSGEAAALAIGLVMLGSQNKEIISDMITYARETQHENITRGSSLAVALMSFGKVEQADATIDELINEQNSNLRYGGCFTLALAYCGTGDKKAIKKLLHVAVSDSSDDVRRAAVIALGFVLIKDYKTIPSIVELLAESYNPHVRYGTAMALGISCAGKGNFSGALDLLEPLTKDPVDFVRQGALIATSLILIQQNEKTYPDLPKVKESFATVIGSKGQEGLAKFGAALSQGIIDAGGRNVTIGLENAHTGTLNVKGIVGLTLFLQSWYWFPLAHFLSLSFAPTTVIGVTQDLKIPKFQLNCNSKKSAFAYPPMSEDVKEKKAQKVETAVLSTTIRAKQRAKKAAAEEKVEDKMDVDEPVKEEDNKSTEEEEVEEDHYELDNLTRVIPTQLKYISFIEKGRFKSVREYSNSNGVVVLVDKTPSEKVEYIKTVRQLNDTEAAMPEPFTLTEEELE
ncbi:proteasome regulatory particle base subunit [Saccharomycopsis crataegensis]|uniref:26S proteasome regulatory subunit RPN2 n=1 Tax=Saccharomycopsis crataegensis TaxID=43959 RepID=A0AAV5QU54_9ASCO|nr:proteasome regulatory particle base subunit [Saccharomycopsis crataegensis]